MEFVHRSRKIHPWQTWWHLGCTFIMQAHEALKIPIPDGPYLMICRQLPPSAISQNPRFPSPPSQSISPWAGNTTNWSKSSSLAASPAAPSGGFSKMVFLAFSPLVGRREGKQLLKLSPGFLLSFFRSGKQGLFSRSFLMAFQAAPLAPFPTNGRGEGKARASRQNMAIICGIVKVIIGMV